MELIPALHFLRLNEIPGGWVDAVWDLEFTERKAIDDPIEEELSATNPRAFRELYQSLLSFTQEEAESTEQSVWAQLQENGISVKTLVAVLSFFVFDGKLKRASVQQRVNALQAASVYLLLLGLPGSIANKVFHEVFLDTCSNMTSHCWPQDTGKKRKKEPPKCSQAEGKRSKPYRKGAQEDLDEDEEEEDAAEHFSGQDLVVIRAAVVHLVESLLRLLQTFPLKGRMQSANNCSQIFIKLLYFEPVIGEINFAEQNISKMKSVPEMAFHGLKLLCSPKHGDQKHSLQCVFRCLLYVILMMNKTSSKKPALLIISQSVLATRNQAIQFICHLVDELKELALSFLRILLQHICFQMVEKSEFRSHGAKAVGMLTEHMSSTGYARFVQWLTNFSQHSKMVGRLFSVDVVMALLEQPERSPEECDPLLVGFLAHRFLIQDVLFARRMDESSTVQGHALSCLALCLELPSMNATRAVQGLFITTVGHTELEAQTTGGGLSSQKTYCSLPFRTVEISNVDSSVCNGKVNLTHLLLHVKDSKTTVRKSALQALVGLLKHNVIPSTWDHLSVLSSRCRDPAVSVKKKALQCVGELLSIKPGCRDVQKAWLQGVLPAVMDSESSVQEKALSALDESLLSHIKVYSVKGFLDMNQKLAWDLLHRVCHDCRSLSRYFSQAFTIWSKQNRFSPAFIQTLLSHTDAPHAEGAWLLLSKVVTASPKLPFGKILDAWDEMINNWKDVNPATLCNVLCVIGDIASYLNVDTQERIISDLMSQLKTFSLSLSVISAAVEALFQYGQSEDIMQTQAFMNQYCGELVSLCESYLAPIILNENGTQNLDEDIMVKYLHTLGVASLNCPAKITKRTILLVECILTTNSDKLTDAQELPASLPLSQFKANSFSTKIRAHGILALGKLCLQHAELMQKYLPVFAREMQEGTEVPVRNNVVILMCDLCVRYTNALDHYIPNISARLRDDCATIRENTLIMLTDLLQEEYVKWKGSLFFRFITVLVDSVPAIASLCEYCLLHLLLKKNPEMFSQHFIECIFHFNSYTQHKSYNKFPQSDKEMVSFSLQGPQHREKRFRIYRFLLEHFTDAQRFSVINKINLTVFACFADQELPLDADGADILSETFSVLSLKEMKLQAMKSLGAAADEPEEENMVMAKAVLEAAQKKVVSQVQKKAFIENTVPLIISLKHLLEQKRSPVLKDLMAYLQVTMHDYRNEVKEFFAADEQLAAEVEFALQEAEKRKEMEERMENCNIKATPENTPTTQSAGLGSPAKPRPPLSLSFATPQPPRNNSLCTRLTLTDRRQNTLPSQPDQRRSNYLEKTVLTKGRVNTRAISTPLGVNVNLTFEEGFSAILSDKSASTMEEVSQLHGRSSEQRAPGLRQWNVQSPLRKKNAPQI